MDTALKGQLDALFVMIVDEFANKDCLLYVLLQWKVSSKSLIKLVVRFLECNMRKIEEESHLERTLEQELKVNDKIRTAFVASRRLEPKMTTLTYMNAYDVQFAHQT